MRVSALIYRSLLLFYPEDLRFAFGDEMTEAFAEDLACAWRERDASGMAAGWWCAACDGVTIAIPGRLANPVLRTRAVSVAVHIAVVGGMLALGAIRDAMPRHAWHGVVELHLRPSADGR